MHDDTSEAVRGTSRRGILRRLGGAAAVAVAGCANGDDGTGGDGTGDAETLVYAQPMSFVDLDPIVLNDVPSQEVASQIFQSPYAYDTSLEPVPELAREEPTVERNGRRWIVSLDSNATFQNGDPVTADDVAYSYTAPLREATENAGEVNMIADVTPLDERTVQFDLEYAFSAFGHYLNRSVVPKAVREADRAAFNADPVGSGPFEFQRGTEGESAVLTRWEDFWSEPAPAVDELVFVPVSEGTTRVTTLKTGENDVVKEIPPTAWETVRKMDDARIEEVLGVNYVYLGFNCNEGPAADPQVRTAVDYAVSMDQAVSRFVDPAGERVHSPIPGPLAEKWDFPTEEWAAIGHDQDVDRAKALLDDAAAVPTDWEPTIIVPPDSKRENVAVSVANGLTAAGYDAAVRRLNWPKFVERFRTGDASQFDAFVLGWSGAPDPDTFMYFLFSHEMIGTTNGTHYRDEELDRKIEDARRATDRAKRRSLYDAAVRTVLEERVHLPAYTLRNSFGVRSRVRDWLAHPVTQFEIVSAENTVTIQ